MGYTVFDIPRLLPVEISALKLGFIVEQEQKEDRINAEASGRSSHTQQQVSSHKQRLARKSRKLQQN